MATSIVKIKVKPEKVTAFEDIIRQLVAASNANEPGLRFYQGFRTANAGEYVMLESFQDVAALKAHTSSAHFTELRGQLVDCFDGAPDVQRLSRSLSATGQIKLDRPLRDGIWNT